MAKNITQAQLKNLDWLSGKGELKTSYDDSSDIETILLFYANKFKDDLILNIKNKNITASGTLEKNITFKTYQDLSKTILEVELPYYAKFVDKGVKGVLSSKNSPSSPYSFKNFGMSEDGKKSLRNYINLSKAKITSKESKSRITTKGEKKFKNIADTKLNRLIYLIKAYGIKTTNFYSDAADKSFKGLEKEISDTIAVNIAINIIK